ncbi:hypothetical protein [uncultured Porphyromonas sp.]|jgi:hypothetical protein|uniref:hypothetical protein n=1 Tax=uncultured Porphyromonas sp. TaxID=159274 RepID=UPI0026119E89|nr:hypothetical protein [uncultured Porphyromonas sp.]
MKKRVSYQDFQRRQKLAEADLVIAERAWQRDLGYIKGLGIKKTLINEVKEQIAPPGSLLGRLLTPSTRKQRRKENSLLSKLTSGSKQSTYSSLTKSDQDGKSFQGVTQRIINTSMSLAKPILWTVGLGMAKGFLRRKFKPLRFILR